MTSMVSTTHWMTDLLESPLSRYARSIALVDGIRVSIALVAGTLVSPRVRRSS
jgi:hypothetical protein